MSELLTRFLDDLAYRRSGSRHTRTNYQRDIERFFDWLSQSEPSVTRLSELTPYDIQKFFTDSSKHHLAPRTQQRQRAALSSFYRFLMRLGLTNSNPVKPVRVPKPEKSLPKALGETALNRDLDAQATSLSLRDRWILEGLYGTGLRVSEFASLRFCDLRPAERRVEVTGKGSKTRSVPLPGSAWGALEHYLAERSVTPVTGQASAPILVNEKGDALSVRTIQRIVHRLLAGVRPGVSVTPHQLRHSYASHLLSGGAELLAVQELLGHARLSTTQVYTHLDPGHMLEIVREFHPRGKVKPQEVI